MQRLGQCSNASGYDWGGIVATRTIKAQSHRRQTVAGCHWMAHEVADFQNVVKVFRDRRGGFP